MEKTPQDRIKEIADGYKGKKVRLPGVKKTKTERAGNVLKVPKSIPSNATIYTQLAKFQELNIVLPRRGTGKINGREYRYATLDDTINMTKAPLRELGITMVQTIENGALKTIFFCVNALGEKTEISSTIEIPKPSSTQDLGASITYLRRYTIAPLLALTSEEDLDAGTGVPVETQVIGQTPDLTQAAKDRVNNTFVPTDPKIMDAIANEQKVQKSEFYNKALTAINNATSGAALELIKTQIGRSTNLTDNEKTELCAIVDARETEVEGTVR